MAFQAVSYDLNEEAIDSRAEGGGESFALALRAGRLTATVVSKKTGTHITVAIKCKRREGRRFQPCELHDAERIYLDTPRPEGPPTEIGQLHLAGKWRGKILPPWEKEMDEARVWAARRVLDVAQGLADADDEQAEILEGKDCLVCSRPLTDPESIKRNIGPECWGKITGLSGHGTHQKPGEDFGQGELEVEDLGGGNAEDGAMGYDVVEEVEPGKPTEAEVIAHDKRNSDIEKIEVEEKVDREEAVRRYYAGRARDEIEDPAEFAKKIVEGSTREAIEAELQQTVVDKETDADLGEPEAERSDLIHVPADADPREILKGLS